MFVEILTEELPPDWRWSPEDQFKTGTTEFYCETAKWLRKFGHDVVVLYDGKPTQKDDVPYWPRQSFTAEEVVLSCNTKSPKMGERNVYYTNFITTRKEDFSGFDSGIVISQYHKDLIGLPGLEVVGLGCYPERYSRPNKIKGLCLYSSSPDRGLSFLKEIWSDVNKETGAELVDTYQRRLSEIMMDDLYKSAEFWLHPGQGVELFCLAGLKAQAAHAIPVFVPAMALAETIKVGIRTTPEDFQKDLIKAIKNPPEIIWPEVSTWEQQTRKIEKILLGV